MFKTQTQMNSNNDKADESNQQLYNKSIDKKNSDDIMNHESILLNL